MGYVFADGAIRLFRSADVVWLVLSGGDQCIAAAVGWPFGGPSVKSFTGSPGPAGLRESESRDRG